jgi:hypothetical protein
MLEALFHSLPYFGLVEAFTFNRNNAQRVIIIVDYTD